MYFHSSLNKISKLYFTGKKENLHRFLMMVICGGTNELDDDDIFFYLKNNKKKKKTDSAAKLLSLPRCVMII